jgi:hypothetical protein
MTGFRVNPASMRETCPQLDQLTQSVSRARGEAAVPIADGAFGRLPESATLHAAFQSCTAVVAQCLDDVGSSIATASRGVATVAGNYETLDRGGADRLAALGSSLPERA